MLQPHSNDCESNEEIILGEVMIEAPKLCCDPFLLMEIEMLVRCKETVDGMAMEWIFWLIVCRRSLRRQYT